MQSVVSYGTPHARGAGGIWALIATLYFGVDIAPHANPANKIGVAIVIVHSAAQPAWKAHIGLVYCDLCTASYGWLPGF